MERLLLPLELPEEVWKYLDKEIRLVQSSWISKRHLVPYHKLLKQVRMPWNMGPQMTKVMTKKENG